MAEIAMLVGPGFEDSELRVPLERLRAAGHRVTTVGLRAGEVLTGKHGRVHVTLATDVTQRAPESFDALVIPGGRSPRVLCGEPAAVAFVRRFVATGRPVAAVCHGPELLVAAGAARGRRMTAWPSVRPALEAAAAIWVDAAVVVDGPFITSRQPADLDAFSGALLHSLGEGPQLDPGIA